MNSLQREERKMTRSFRMQERAVRFERAGGGGWRRQKRIKRLFRQAARIMEVRRERYKALRAQGLSPRS